MTSEERKYINHIFRTGYEMIEKHYGANTKEAFGAFHDDAGERVKLSGNDPLLAAMFVHVVFPVISRSYREEVGLL